MDYMPLSALPIGAIGRVDSLNTSGAQRRRMQDLGIIKGTSIKALHKSPSGDPTAYFIRGAVIALRSEDAQKILISPEVQHGT